MKIDIHFEIHLDFAVEIFRAPKGGFVMVFIVTVVFNKEISFP